MRKLLLMSSIVAALGTSVLAVDRSLIMTATTDKHANYHIVIREILSSTNQSDWEGVYNATVELHIGAQEMDFKGSTLPNFVPVGGKPSDWEYSVVMANCAFPAGLTQRVYTWKRETDTDSAKQQRPILRLTKLVPTVKIGTERIPREFLSRLSTREQQDLLQFAQDILVHSGEKAEWRGSAGCLTIRPSDAAAFFAAIPPGTEGTLEIARGVQDNTSNSSYCY